MATLNPTALRLKLRHPSPAPLPPLLIPKPPLCLANSRHLFLKRKSRSTDTLTSLPRLLLDLAPCTVTVRALLLLKIKQRTASWPTTLYVTFLSFHWHTARQSMLTGGVQYNQGFLRGQFADVQLDVQFAHQSRMFQCGPLTFTSNITDLARVALQNAL